jgi:PPOX class probable F420-dependent enzyme
VSDIPSWAASARYLALGTSRRDGQVVWTPVWFAPAGDELLVLTDAGSGKVKRLRRHPGVRISPCDIRGRRSGPDTQARAVVLDDGGELARCAIWGRYGMIARLYFGLTGATTWLRRTPTTKSVTLRISMP